MPLFFIYFFLNAKLLLIEKWVEFTASIQCWLFESFRSQVEAKKKNRLCPSRCPAVPCELCMTLEACFCWKCSSNSRIMLTFEAPLYTILHKCIFFFPPSPLFDFNVKSNKPTFQRAVDCGHVERQLVYCWRACLHLMPPQIAARAQQVWLL